MYLSASLVVALISLVSLSSAHSPADVLQGMSTKLKNIDKLNECAYNFAQDQQMDRLEEWLKQSGLKYKGVRVRQEELSPKTPPFKGFRCNTSNYNAFGYAELEGTGYLLYTFVATE